MERKPEKGGQGEKGKGEGVEGGPCTLPLGRKS